MDQEDLSTHARWIVSQVDGLLEAIETGSDDVRRRYEAVAHAIVEARPHQLRQFLEYYDIRKCEAFADLMALAWRVVGNEFRDDPAVVENAVKSIVQLCDGYREATEAYWTDEPGLG